MSVDGAFRSDLTGQRCTVALVTTGIPVAVLVPAQRLGQAPGALPQTKVAQGRQILETPGLAPVDRSTVALRPDPNVSSATGVTS
jgi:antitoxin (DNA-binding transcriptional repressor) of toxin-antitoxin stability system